MRNLLCCLIIVLLFSNCRKNDDNPDSFTLIENRAKTLSEDKVFVAFVSQYAEVLTSFAVYQSDLLAGKQNLFVREMADCPADAQKAEQVFTKYGLSADKVISYQNQLDNLLLSLLNEKPDLLSLNTDDMNAVVRRAIAYGGTSSSESWRQTRLQMAAKMKAGTMRKVVGHTTKSVDITPDELWNCAKEAIGLNIASQAFLRSMSSSGIKMITLSVSKLLAKYAGPIGTAIMVADFSFCLYSAS